MRRAAIYARFSTDLQRDRSIDDQVALCRAFADRQGLTVARVYSDRARTSASLIGRDGLLDLLTAAQAGEIDAVIVEAFDRVSRDQGDLASVHKRLSFAGVELLTVNDGAADTLKVGMHGLFGELWMEGHRKKVHRGQAGVLRDGRHPGGRAYGYRAIPGAPGELAIVEDEAGVIRSIFADYAGGATPREIAAALNRDGVLPPRGARWNASTLAGNFARGYGLLANDLYRGELVWNRVRMVRDPATGRRVSRVRPAEEWMRAPAPHLRIVDEALWQAVSARRDERSHPGGRGKGRAQARPLRPLSGLIRCGCCGGTIQISKRRGASVWGRCSRTRESGTCDMRREVRIDRIERQVMDGLAAELRDPVYVRAYLAEYHAERRRLAAEARRDRTRLERDAAKARAAYDRAHRLYCDGITDGPEAEADIRAKLQAARAAEAALAEADAEDDVVELHPASIARYLAALEDLAAEVTGAASTAEAVPILRELVERVVVTPDGDQLDIRVEGYIAALTGRPEPACRVSMVAEGRLARSPTAPMVRVRA